MDATLKTGLKELYHRQEILKVQLAEAKADVAAVADAIADMLAVSAKDIRKQQGKDIGVVNFVQDGFKVKHTISPQVSWDQKQLADTRAKIAASGDNPDEYINVKFSVPESKYKAWPTGIKKAFESARTVTVGNPKVVLEPEEVAA
jgi:hypothetical protein